MVTGWSSRQGFPPRDNDKRLSNVPKYGGALPSLSWAIGMDPTIFCARNSDLINFPLRNH